VADRRPGSAEMAERISLPLDPEEAYARCLPWTPTHQKRT
jgi:hypothetical protein